MTVTTESRPSRRLRKVAVAAALGGTVATAGFATAAQASQAGVQAPGQTSSYATWFWGRTQVCFKDLGYLGQPVAYNWSSSTSFGSGYLAPGQENCNLVRSFVGFRISVSDIGGDYLQVRFPIGP